MKRVFAIVLLCGVGVLILLAGCSQEETPAATSASTNAASTNAPAGKQGIALE